MRIGDRSFYAKLLSGLELQRQRTDRGLAQLSDQKRVRVASDNPNGHHASMSLRARLTRVVGYNNSGATAQTDLSTIEVVLGQAVNLMIQASSIALQGASDTSSPANDILANEVEALREQLLSLANKDQSGRYLFAGTETKTAPFDASGAYFGDNAEVAAALDTQQQVGATLSGQRVFLDGGDLFAQLDALAQALRIDDSAAVAATIPGLGASTKYLGEIQAEVGNRLKLIGDTATGHANETLLLTQRISAIEDIDFAETIVQLESANTSSQALSTAAARFLGRSLFDYLG